MKTSLTFELARKAALHAVEAALAKQTALCRRQICTRLQVKLHKSASEVMLRISEVRQSRSEVFASEQLRKVFVPKT